MIFLESSNTECAGESLRTRMRFRRMFILSPLRDCTFSHSLGQEPTRALQQKPHHSMTSSAIASSVGGTLAERLRGPEIDLGDGLKRGRLGRRSMENH